jgi:hypothetical protein
MAFWTRANSFASKGLLGFPPSGYEISGLRFFPVRFKVVPDSADLSTRSPCGSHGADADVDFDMSRCSANELLSLIVGGRPQYYVGN